MHVSFLENARGNILIKYLIRLFISHLREHAVYVNSYKAGYTTPVCGVLETNTT